MIDTYIVEDTYHSLHLPLPYLGLPWHSRPFPLHRIIEEIEWDKDENDALDFATAAANLRAHIFGIPSKTRFDVKRKYLSPTLCSG